MAYAEVLPLSGWCNPTRPTFPPVSPYRFAPKSVSPPFWAHKAPHPYCIVHAPIPPPSPPQKFELNPAAQEFCPNRRKQTHNPLGGKLVAVAVMFFERAYGLNGQQRVDHEQLKREMIALTGCSERAVYAVLYGSSYADLLAPLRAQVPTYRPTKGSEITDATQLPFYHYDGNNAVPFDGNNAAQPTKSARVEEPAEQAAADVIPEAAVPPPDPEPIPTGPNHVSEPNEDSKIVMSDNEKSFIPMEKIDTSSSSLISASPAKDLDPRTMDHGTGKHYPTLILLALVAVLPLTLLC